MKNTQEPENKTPKASTIFAIDPGTERSGMVRYSPDSGAVAYASVRDNNAVAEGFQPTRVSLGHPRPLLAIEMVACYGMPVGREVFETCRWIGRFQEAWESSGGESVLIYRRDVKLALCNSVRAKDANVRRALLDLFPATGGGKTPQVGTKAQPGPLYGVKSHAWAALGVAVTAAGDVDRLRADRARGDAA